MAESNNMGSLEALPPSSVKITQQTVICHHSNFPPAHDKVRITRKSSLNVGILPIVSYICSRWCFEMFWILKLNWSPLIPLFLWRLWIETPRMMNQMQLSLPSYCARLDLRSYSQAGMENFNLTSPGHKHQIHIITGFYMILLGQRLQNHTKPIHLFGNLGIFVCKADTTMKYPSDWSSVRALGPKVPSTPLSISQRKMLQENARAQHGLNFLKSRNGF